MMTDLQLTSGDCVTVQSIHDYAAVNNVRPKLMYYAIVARLVAAGFGKPEGLDNTFKEGYQFLGEVPSSSEVKLISFFNLMKEHKKISETSLVGMRQLIPQRVLFSGAPDWAVDVRRGWNPREFLWTDGEHRYKHFGKTGNQGRKIEDLSRYRVVATRPLDYWHQSIKDAWCQEFEYAFSRTGDESIAEAVYRLFAEGLIQPPNLEQSGVLKYAADNVQQNEDL